MKTCLLLILVNLLFLIPLKAENYFCGPNLGRMPIQQSGRTKPLYVHAKEMIKYLSGKKSVDGHDPVTAYCLLSAKGLGIPTKIKLTARVDHIGVKKLLDIDEKSNIIDFSSIIDSSAELRTRVRLIKGNTPEKKAITKLLSQAGLYSDIISATNWMIPSTHQSALTWLPLASFFQEDKVKSLKVNDPFKTLLIRSSKSYEKNQGKNHLIEYYYAKANLPTWSLIITLLALAALTLFRRFTIALNFAGLTILLQTILLIVRVIISGRAPITNMYETVMFSGYGALILSMIIGHFRKEKVFVYMGLAYNACTLMMMNFATSMLSESISPLVPVLRDNFWLSTHVTTIIMSYGALALSWILANTVLIKRKISAITKQDEVYYADLVYSCLKYGTIMLGAGIILGGVWADYSWGRFWGWDPKETWSLIAFCFYMAILHGRYTNWIPNHRFMSLTAAAFMSVMMAWFGVNYILASGLHSYGFSEGGAIFLGSFFLVQSIVLLLTARTKKNAITNI